MSKATRKRLSRLKVKVGQVSAPVPEEVAGAMKFHAETGQWPENVRPKVREMAEMLQEGARAIDFSVAQPCALAPSQAHNGEEE